MSKYTTEQLQEMARQAQQFRGTMRYVGFVGLVGTATKLTFEQVEDRIDLLAAGLPVTH